MTNFLIAAETAARAAAKVLLDYRDRAIPREKGPRDLVSEADLAAQKVIRELLLSKFPDHGFLGEEDEAGPPSDRVYEYRWIVDPLDGTTNYLHKLPAFAVSIALERRGKLVCGVVYDPSIDECFAAEAGEGAWINGQPLRTSGCKTAEKALVAASFSALVERDSVEIRRFIEALIACQGVRRLGSAALNLAYVAAGRLDAYWATSVKIWDVAAGVLLIQEAGGVVTHVTGRPILLRAPELLVAATPELHREMLELIERSNG